MKLNEIVGKKKASSLEDLITSIKNGKFTKDGSHLKTDGDFSCSHNNLTSLEGVPNSVDGTFHCHHNKLTSLKGAPNSTGSFYCFENNLTSLMGAPSLVSGDFECGKNKLTSLDGAPNSVGGDFACSDNLISFEGGTPRSIGGDFVCVRNKLTSLFNIHKHIIEMNGTFYAHKNPIESHVLGLLKIPGCKTVVLDNKEVEAIIDKYLPLGDLIDCQEELIEAGFAEYAQL